MIDIKNKNLIKTLIVLSFFVLSCALFVEFILNHKPCVLCKIQRIPFFLTIIMGSLAIIFKKFEKISFILILIFFLFGLLASLYHLGIEQGFFEDSFVCKLENLKNYSSSENLLKDLDLSNKPVSCREVTFRIMGFSLASINALLSLLVSMVMIIKLKNYGKNR